MHSDYNHIISLENLYQAWQEFIRGKKNKKDVAEFAFNLSSNICQLHLDLKDSMYEHGGYQAFAINDPKPRKIHKASVRDRLLHHAIYRCLYLNLELRQRFVYDSYSCRNSKGTHKALERFRILARAVSRRHHRTCWVLKCDVKKFFDSIDHEILLLILSRHFNDSQIIALFKNVIESFSVRPGKGLPLGNLTSQLLVNIYMNEFDQFLKHKLKAKYYIRYADDFVILSKDRGKLENFLPKISDFLERELKLKLHPDKIFIKTLASSVDFLGWVHFPDHRVLRTTTKRRMFKRLCESDKQETRQSYLGMLKWGNAYKLLKNQHMLGI